jgi:glycosyltransferase involved in cell wall biosynthesis
MPVYNAQRYLAAAVQSVLDQTFSDFEFIVINDGSTDRSETILQEFAAKDSRVRVVSRPNTGLTRALNEALSLAKAPLIARMDADDISLPQRLELQVARFGAEPDLVLLGGAYELIDAAGRLLTTRQAPLDNQTLNDTLLGGRNPFCHPTVMMSADALQKVGGYDPATELAEDLDLFLKLAEVGRVACLSDVLLRYRLHSGSVSEKKQQAQVQMLKHVCESAWARRGIQREFQGGAPWRPVSGRKSTHQFALQYGWWAFNSAQRRTAMVYGMKAIGAVPWNLDGWRLLACAMLKRVSPPASGKSAG